MFFKVVPLFLLQALACSAALAQLTEFPGPSPEHQFLKKFVGQWSTSSECIMGPGQPPLKMTSATKSRMIGEFWVVSEVDLEANGAPMKALQTIGYDAAKKKYVGTWIDSMLGHLWQYEGTVDETGKILTLEATGPNFMTGKGETKYRDVYEFKSPDHVVATSFALGEGGEWVQYVTAHTKRKPDAVEK